MNNSGQTMLLSFPNVCRLPVQDTMGIGKTLQRAKTIKGKRVRKLRDNPTQTKTGKVRTGGIRGGDSQRRASRRRRSSLKCLRRQEG
ncbi:hypothetical protein TNCV_2739601 [Trichonephila clavipes]|nr:hypothetical protein TNCV_2739601 [Trichonephila clavipes]